MKLIVGLGNPGKKYQRNRHNAGFLALNFLAAGARWQTSGRAQAEYTKIEFGNTRVELLKPATYMNNSGVAVAYAAKKHGLSPEDIIVIHDDKDIPLGQTRVQKGRGAAGHNGVSSIFEHLGSQNFWRIRLGVAPAAGVAADTADFVLGNLTAAEQKALRAVFAHVKDEIIQLLQ